MVDVTKNFKFNLIAFDKVPWNTEQYDNWHIVDALMARFLAISNVQGTYQNALAVTVGQRFIDTADDTIFEVLVAHTTPSTGTFATNRTLIPTNWQGVTLNATFRGTWAVGSVYNVNEFVLDARRYGIISADHTSVTSYNQGVTDGNIITLVDGDTLVSTSPIANGLSVGSSPTVSFNSSTGVFTFGIPVGATGATGADGDLSQSIADEIRRRGGSAHFQAQTNRNIVEDLSAFQTLASQTFA